MANLLKQMLNDYKEAQAFDKELKEEIEKAFSKLEDMKKEITGSKKVKAHKSRQMKRLSRLLNTMKKKLFSEDETDENDDLLNEEENEEEAEEETEEEETNEEAQAEEVIK